MNEVIQACVLMIESDPTNNSVVLEIPVYTDPRSNCISGGSVESQPTLLLRADVIPHLDMPGVSCCQKWLCLGKSVEKGGRGSGEQQLEFCWVLRVLKVIFQAAKRSQTTCCWVMGELKSGCPLLSNVFLQVGCK